MGDASTNAEVSSLVSWKTYPQKENKMYDANVSSTHAAEVKTSCSTYPADLNVAEHKYRNVATTGTCTRKAASTFLFPSERNFKNWEKSIITQSLKFDWSKINK